MNQLHTSCWFLLLALMLSSTVVADDRTSEIVQLMTIEAVTIDGNIFVSIETANARLVARSLTFEGTDGPLTIAATPLGLEMRNSRMTLFSRGKLELKTDLKIRKLDVISLETGHKEK